MKTVLLTVKAIPTHDWTGP